MFPAGSRKPAGNKSPASAASRKPVGKTGSSAARKPVSSALRKPISKQPSQISRLAEKMKKIKLISPVKLAGYFSLIVVGLLVLALIGYQIYLHFYLSLRTMTAVEITISETIETTGWTVRDETVLSTDKSGVIVPDVDNGGKVSKGQAVALVFESTEAANAYSRIAQIDQAIAEFESMITAKEDINFENSVDGIIDNELLALARAARSGDLPQVDSVNDQILYLLNKKQIANHAAENFNENIAALKAEREALAAAYPNAPGRITSSLSGYYVGKVDGYEQILTTQALGEMTPEAFDAALASYTGEVPTAAVGKIADDYIWNIVCTITAKEAEKLSVGKSYSLELPYSEVESVSARLTALNPGAEDKVLAVFEINVTISELLEVRSQPVTIVLVKATGLGVPRDALRVEREVVSNTDENGNKLEDGVHEVSNVGVYIMYGRAIKFRKVEIIRSVGDMVVVEINNGSGWLRRYDEIIVGGRGLYDGKIVQY